MSIDYATHLIIGYKINSIPKECEDIDEYFDEFCRKYKALHVISGNAYSGYGEYYIVPRTCEDKLTIDETIETIEQLPQLLKDLKDNDFDVDETPIVTAVGIIF